MPKCPVCSQNWDGIRRHSSATLKSLKIANSLLHEAVCNECIGFAKSWSDFQCHIASNQSRVEEKPNVNVADNSNSDSKPRSISHGHPICRVCKINFNSVASYMCHIQKKKHLLKVTSAKFKRGSVKNKYFCSFCEFSTSKKKETIDHIREIHNFDIGQKLFNLIAIPFPSNENQPQSTEKRFEELPDPSPRSVKKKSLSKHLCEKCDSTFTDPIEFKSHRKDCDLFKILLDESCDIKRMCDKCNKLFSSLKEVSSHSSTCQLPTKINPVEKITSTKAVDEKKCPECGDDFPEVHIRNRHLLVYHGKDINAPKKNNEKTTSTRFGEKIIAVEEDTTQSNNVRNRDTEKSNVENIAGESHRITPRPVLSTRVNRYRSNDAGTPSTLRAQPAYHNSHRRTYNQFSPRDNNQNYNYYRPRPYSANHYQNHRDNFRNRNSDWNANRYNKPYQRHRSGDSHSHRNFNHKHDRNGHNGSILGR